MSDPRPAARVKDRDALFLFRLEHLGEPCDLCERRPGSQVHHKVFRSQSGGDVPSNLEWLCHICHGERHGL
jgi:hypothetical protein